jgi:hypothetical protein
MIITLALAGYEQSRKNITTFDEESVNFAKSAIQKIEAGKASETGNFGVLQYSYKTKEFPDGKNNALGGLHFNIGYILYYNQGKNNPARKKDALQYFYKATKHTSFSKNEPIVYQAIGAWYLDEAIRIDSERQRLVKEAGGKDTEETLAMIGMQKGYADRAIDAYARAYRLAPTTNKTYRDSLYTRLKELFAFRFDGNTSGIDTYVSTVMNRPMPDPSVTVTPVAETSTTANTTSMTTTKMDEPTPPTTSGKATTTNGAGAASKTTTTATKAKTAAKPAPKKKGTR